MDFQKLWLDAIAEEKSCADPQVLYVFSATDIPVASGAECISKPHNEDAECILIVSEAASHTHHTNLLDGGGVKQRDVGLRFPALEECGQHPMLSYLDGTCLHRMRQRCRSETIMTLSFRCKVTPSARFIVTDDGIRVTGTNLEEDRILCVTSDRGRVPSKDYFNSSDYEGVLHRLLLNSSEDIRRRQNGLLHTRWSNVSRSVVLAIFKIGGAMIDAVENIASAIKSGVPSEEIIWKEDGITIFAEDLRSVNGFGHTAECESLRDPVVDLLLSGANREVIGIRGGVPPPIRLAKEENCIEKRLVDYCRAIVLNRSSKVSKFALMAATVEALIEVGGIESTLNSLCTSSMAKELSRDATLYEALRLEWVLGLKCQELVYLSQPLTQYRNNLRSQRTRELIRKACELSSINRMERKVKEEEVLHDPELLKEHYCTGNFELDLVAISDHLIHCSKFIWHDTEIRMLNLLAIGAEMIREQLQGAEKCARFCGTTVTANADQGFSVRSNCGVAVGFCNLRALTSRENVFSAMLSFMEGGPEEGFLNMGNPTRMIADRTLFVRNTFKRFHARGMSRARAIETAVMAAKVLSIRRTLDFKSRVLADVIVVDTLKEVRGCFFEESTGIDIADIAYDESEKNVDMSLRGCFFEESTGIENAAIKYDEREESTEMDIADTAYDESEDSNSTDGTEIDIAENIRHCFGILMHLVFHGLIQKFLGYRQYGCRWCMRYGMQPAGQLKQMRDGVETIDGDPREHDHLLGISVDPRQLRSVPQEKLGASSFELLDHTEHYERYGKFEVHEDAVAFSAAGQKYFAYCVGGRVYVRKRGLLEELRKRFGGNKVALTLFGTGLSIELKERQPLHSDAEAMDLIMSVAREGSDLGFWIWSKILKGRIRYVATEDSCMWNTFARSSDALLQGQWSVPKWVLRYMVVLSKDGGSQDSILVQAGDGMPVFELKDNGLTRYSCQQVPSSVVNRKEYRKAFFEPTMTVAGERHPRR